MSSRVWFIMIALFVVVGLGIVGWTTYSKPDASTACGNCDARHQGLKKLRPVAID